MAFYGVGFFLAIRAIDVTTGQAKNGDLANVTLYINRDGTDITFSGTPVARANGVYGVQLTDAEAAGIDFLLTGSSVTPNVALTENRQSVVPATIPVSYSAAAAAASSIPVPAGTVQIIRGDSFSRDLTGLGSLVGRSKLWLTVKSIPKTDRDSAAIFQIEETGGLVVLKGRAPASSGLASITVTDATAGNITVAMNGAAAALLNSGVYYYDVQVLTGADTATPSLGGQWIVLDDVTRAVT